ncbi:DEAD/DEAH box helicase [Nanoarchaeota archaeon]
MQYKQFTLDKFQEDAIHSIEKHNSVVVSAATGTGKTLIADYVIDKFIKEGKRVIYTAPIKALSNQKFRDFKKEYGDKIGLMTGDVVINPDAQIIIMTTEIYRNMLLAFDSLIDQLSYVIFDEIHFMTDIERGTVWEESIIFSPPHIRFLCLSATIPNAKEFAEWISTINEHTVDVVEYNTRAVPLDHYLYDVEFGITRAKELRKHIIAEEEAERFYGGKRRGKKRRFKKKKWSWPNHLDLIEDLQSEDNLPCIFFVFSRKACEEKGKECFHNFNFTTPQERVKIISIYNKLITPVARTMRSTQIIRQAIANGVGIHHAGVLPILKEIVETLFNLGLIKVLYATETFAVGINMPARSVAFNTLDKYDGISFRNLYSKEYFQMAGRAGRRGIDEKGFVYAMFDRNIGNIDNIIKVTTKDIEPIISQFRLTYNTVLNLVAHYDDKQIEIILKKNFGYFVAKRETAKQIRIMGSFNAKVRLLKKLNYIDKEGHLTHKGQFATKIYAYELVVTELMFAKMFNKLSENQINLVMAGVVYEPRRGDRFKMTKSVGFSLPEDNRIIVKEIKVDKMQRLFKLVNNWCKGEEFKNILQYSNLAEGDIIRLFRRIIDQLRQLKRATEDNELRDKISRCIGKLDRDIVKVEF